jgi:hypothetical protein
MLLNHRHCLLPALPQPLQCKQAALEGIHEPGRRVHCAHRLDRVNLPRPRIRDAACLGVVTHGAGECFDGEVEHRFRD